MKLEPNHPIDFLAWPLVRRIHDRDFENWHSLSQGVGELCDLAQRGRLQKPLAGKKGQQLRAYRAMKDIYLGAYYLHLRCHTRVPEGYLKLRTELTRAQEIGRLIYALAEDSERCFKMDGTERKKGCSTYMHLGRDEAHANFIRQSQRLTAMRWSVPVQSTVLKVAHHMIYKDVGSTLWRDELLQQFQITARAVYAMEADKPARVPFKPDGFKTWLDGMVATVATPT